MRGTFSLAYCNTKLMLADILSKPCLGDTFKDKVLWATGDRFYPPYDSLHYKQLQLDKYPINKTTPTSPSRRRLPKISKQEIDKYPP